MGRNLAVEVGENCSLKEELSTSEGISEKLQSLQLHLNEKDQKNQELESNEKKLKSIEHTLQEKIKELQKEKDDMSESQQEAILHLKDKVQDLRSQLNQDHENKTQFEESIKKKDETIKVLRKESELFASELVINENDRENLHRNLAVKVGENCCLKEELSTSEGISEKLQSLQLHLNE